MSYPTREAIRAVGKVSNAIKNGTLVRNDICEVCGKKAKSIVAHHWNGYDKPLDVWWICRSCNRNLQHKHDGSLTREQALDFVNPWRLQPRDPVFDDLHMLLQGGT